MQRVLDMLKDPRTWGTLLYLFLMLPLGVFYFTFVDRRHRRARSP